MSEEKRPEWMSNISSLVNPDDYLLGRKIDKTFELSEQEKAQKAKEQRAELLASNKLKLAEDPILESEKRLEQLKMEIISNPIKLRQLREILLREDAEKQKLAAGSSYRPMEDDTKERLSPRIERPSHSRQRRSQERSRHRHDRDLIYDNNGDRRIPRSPPSRSSSSSSSDRHSHRSNNRRHYQHHRKHDHGHAHSDRHRHGTEHRDKQSRSSHSSRDERHKDRDKNRDKDRGRDRDRHSHRRDHSRDKKDSDSDDDSHRRRSRHHSPKSRSYRNSRH